jgi:hypothetical protein
LFLSSFSGCVWPSSVCSPLLSVAFPW